MRNQHEYLHEMAKRDYTTINGQIISVVYVTATPTFNGVIGGYTTSDDDSTPTVATQKSISSAAASAGSSSTSASSSSSRDPFSYDLSTLTAGRSSAAATAGSNANAISQSSAASYTYGAATSSPSSPSAAVSVGSGSDSSNVSTGSSSSDTSDPGISTAGKAGLAIGIILAIGAVLALLLFLLGKKKRQNKAEQARQDSEKNAAAAAAKAQPAAAPRLSLRPASSFLPEFMVGARPKSRLSQGNMLGGASSEPNPLKEKYLAAPAPQNIPMTQKNAPVENPFKDPENPFADPVQPASQQPAPEPLRMPEPPPKPEPVLPELVQMPVPIVTPAAAPVEAPIAMPEPVYHSTEKIAISAATAGAQAVQRHSELTALPQEPVEMPSAPVSMPAPLAPPKASNANGSPGQAGTPDGQVYRILMDFAPSMEDELELKSGQVVRMLHEYDDGWVSTMPRFLRYNTDFHSVSALDSTARNKVLSHELASLLSHRNLVLVQDQISNAQCLQTWDHLKAVR